MRNIILEFVRRGMCSFGFGPIVLAVLYLVLGKQGALEMIAVDEVCSGVFSLSVLAFIAGGMNVIYQLERVPLMVAILIHGIVLYIAYLITYLVNGWLEQGITPIVVFSVIFVVSYMALWVVIYSIIKRRTDRLNWKLKQKKEKEETM